MRRYSLDILRLVAILLMLYAHVVSYFYTADVVLIVGLKDWANIVCFTTFLFVSGAVTYLAYLKNFRKNNLPRAKLLKRTGILLTGYYLLAIIVSAEAIFQPERIVLAKLIRILLLLDVPGYTEFLLPFVFYALLLLAMPRMIKQVATNGWLLLIVGGGLYVAGELLALNLDLSGALASWGSLVWGDEGLYRFPVLQYLIVWLIGIHWGTIMLDGEEEAVELKRESYLLGILLLVALAAFAYQGEELVLRRWPPSLAFLAVGLAWVGFQLIFVFKIKRIARVVKRIYRSWGWFSFITEHAFAVLIVHTALITVAVQAGEFKTNNAGVLLTEFLGSLVLTTFLVYILSQLNQILSGKDSRRSYLALFILGVTGVLLIGAISLLGERQLGFPLPGGNNPPSPSQKPATIIKPWYSEVQPQRYRLEFASKVLTRSDNTQWAQFSLNHQALVKSKQSRADAKDFELVVWDGKRYEEVKFAVAQLNTSEAVIAFQLPAQVEPLAEAKDYELYLGNLLANKANYQDSFPETVNLRFKVNLKQESFPLAIQTEREWFVPGTAFNFSFSLPEAFTEADQLTYAVFPVDLDQPAKPSNALLNKFIPWEPSREYQLQLPLNELPYGAYYLQLTITLPAGEQARAKDLAPTFSIGGVRDQGVIVGTKVGFRYSAPLLMSWTIDWEGYDLQQNYMNQMAELSQTYQMPMTHYFNPRIYTNPAISPERAKYLTNWVKQRERAGDEIALHLHMHFDLVAAAGLTPKTEPRWGGRQEGHDVLTTAYDYTEFKQLVSWSLQKFQENGLGKPKGYRAGGWFLDLENIRALDDLGFIYDSSGSDYLSPYGPNQQKREWNLTPTSKPYRPSKTNQNKTTPPQFKLWEYPNNGADSTNREASELVRRLQLNLPTAKGYLAEPQVLTYLSHPHWFGTIDNPKMVSLFVAAEQYKFANDNGPVVYVTQIEAHNKYTNLLTN